VVNIVLNLVIEIPLLWPMGEAAMAVGTLVSFAIQAFIMLWLLDRRMGGLGLRSIITPALKMLLATAIMGAACWAVMRSPIYPVDESRFAWATQLILVMSVGASVYCGACYVLGVEIMKQFVPKRWR
jgi:peptidoglycan biosynthesis protein MviN/MurJ (putative lipid II flippase)